MAAIRDEPHSVIVIANDGSGHISDDFGPITGLVVYTAEIGHVDAAHIWLCRQRAHYPANADIWHLRFHWHDVTLPLFNGQLQKKKLTVVRSLLD